MDNGREIRVILAEDHPEVRLGIRRMLSREDDIQVIGESGNGEDALKLVDELKPDVLLLDIEMPCLNGIEVTRKIRQMKKPVHILILSGYVDQDYVRLVMEQGACGYLAKEDAPRKLLYAVRKVANNGMNDSRPHEFVSGWSGTGVGGNLRSI